MNGFRKTDISIHAPRTGSDPQPFTFFFHFIISIHAPRTGSDPTSSPPPQAIIVFQSTLPARGATPDARTLGRRERPFQSTLPARGATWRRRWTASASAFQSTLPARGATVEDYAFRTDEQNFNPRSPHGERPREYAASVTETEISIHAPRTGSDHARRKNGRIQLYFNPRSPHGERHTPRAWFTI